MSRSGDSNRTSTPSAAAKTDSTGFVSRLQSILRLWPSADRLARATGVSPSAFRKWLRGDAEPSRERLVALAEAAGVNVGWLANGEGPEPRLRDHRSPRTRDAGGNGLDDYVWLPQRPKGAAAGPDVGEPAPDTGFFGLRHDWVRSVLGIDPPRLQIETALGESMLPGIQDGDLLFIDTAEQKVRGIGIYVLDVAGERLVKRVQPKLDGSLALISDNPAYETEYLQPEQAGDVRVVGRVLWICGPIRGSRRVTP